MPQSVLPRQRMSFGRCTSAGMPQSSRSVSLTASPAARFSNCTSPGFSAGRKSMENIKFFSSRLCQLLPRRPRPSLCRSRKRQKHAGLRPPAARAFLSPSAWRIRLLHVGLHLLKKGDCLAGNVSIVRRAESLAPLCPYNTLYPLLQGPIQLGAPFVPEGADGLEYRLTRRWRSF